MENLERLLKEHGQQKLKFSSTFADDVMAHVALEKQARVVPIWQKSFWYSAVASILFLLSTSVVIDGDLSFDWAMGMSNYSDYEIGQMLDTDQSYETIVDGYFEN